MAASVPALFNRSRPRRVERVVDQRLETLQDADAIYHVANRLDPQYFETVVEMLKTSLGFIGLRRTERAIWQPGANLDLPFSRSPTSNRDPDKLRSQISFLSPTPRSDLEALAAWARQHGMNAEVGSYSDREFYLDAPAAFVDFARQVPGISN